MAVLLFSLGPRDLDEEVEDYCTALESGDAEAQRRVAKELLERDPPDAAVGRNAAVEQAIYVQANNRIFGVVFWFLVAGPTGAWLFRLLDLMRRRVQYQAIRRARKCSTACWKPCVICTLRWRGFLRVCWRSATCFPALRKRQPAGARRCRDDLCRQGPRNRRQGGDRGRPGWLGATDAVEALDRVVGRVRS